MSVLGIVAEYNPFHNGHLYHIERSKELCNPDAIICVMSGNFIQRGEPSIVNKWARTKMALLSGVDLVIELPVVYSMSSAEFFSYAAVKLLNSTGVVNHISFGSETGTLEQLELIRDILLEEPIEFKLCLKDELSKGLSFPVARSKAIVKYLEGSTNQFKQVLTGSNNILAIEYLKALKLLKSNIKPITIERSTNSYNQTELSGNISSATSIRRNLQMSMDNQNVPTNLTFPQKEHSKPVLSSIESKKTSQISISMPKTSLDILNGEFLQGKGPIFSSDFENIILSSLRTIPLQQIETLPYVSEGLENRLKSFAEKSSTIDEFIDSIATKRFATTRLQRSVFSILTGLTHSEFEYFNQNGGPQYIRILGHNEKGRKLLSQMRKKASLPLITKFANHNNVNEIGKKLLEKEIIATNNYVLAYKNKDFKTGGQEFTTGPIII